MQAAGDLDRRVTIQRLKSDTLDSSGQVDRTAGASWEAFDIDDAGDGGRWAKLHTTGGREFAKSQAIYSDLSHVLDVRHDTRTAALTSANRLLLDGNVVELLAAFEVTDGGQRREVVRLVGREST